MKIQHRHRCERMKTMRCAPGGRFGHVGTGVLRYRGIWYFDNGEYAGEIWFCPFCGRALKEPIEEDEEEAEGTDDD